MSIPCLFHVYSMSIPYLFHVYSMYIPRLFHVYVHWYHKGIITKICVNSPLPPSCRKAVEKLQKRCIFHWDKGIHLKQQTFFLLKVHWRYPTKLSFVFYCSFFAKISNLQSPFITSELQNSCRKAVKRSRSDWHCWCKDVASFVLKASDVFAATHCAIAQ